MLNFDNPKYAMKVKEIPTSLLSSIGLSLKSKHGLTKGKKQIPVVVSLASIPSRLGIVGLTIRSILNQDILPKKVVLWLHKDLKNDIPQKLAALEGDLFSIEFSDYHSSHRKLVDTLRLFPDNVIVTCDDDMMYRKNWLSKLYEMHQKYPSYIVANHTRCISYDSNGKLLPYTAWEFGSKSCKTENAVLPIGAGGTLYPPGALDARVHNRALFLELTPKADDLWFKAMALLNDTKSILAENRGKDPIPIWGSQKVSLKKSNIKEDKNRTQWLALMEHFNLKL